MIWDLIFGVRNPKQALRKSGRSSARARRHFLSSKNSKKTGQATIEYALLLGIAAVIGLGVLSALNPIIQEGTLFFNANLERELMQGGFTEASEWEN